MGFPESQLNTWSNIGSQTNSASTYASIEKSFSDYNWPEDLKYKTYLQGSYANSTNIRGNSDVDIVIQLNPTFYSNLTDEQKRALGVIPAKYDFSEIKKHALNALKKYYGEPSVDDSGGKSLKVSGDDNRLPADVIPCVTYRRYDGLNLQAEGMKFFNKNDSNWIINYPLLHINNGEDKNSKNRTSHQYKKTVRMFKNIREYIIGSSDKLRKIYPSYFVECLTYNILDHLFESSLQSTFSNSTRFLINSIKDGTYKKFVTQSRQEYLIGKSHTQWPDENAIEFINKLSELL